MVSSCSNSSDPLSYPQSSTCQPSRSPGHLEAKTCEAISNELLVRELSALSLGNENKQADRPVSW